MNNGIQPDYGFNIPEQPSPAYGFNQQGMAPPMQPAMNTGSPMPPYPPETPQSSFPSPQFAANILAEPMVANMAMQYGDALVGSGKQHLQKYVPVSALKYYFAVDTDYVFLKLALLFFPFTHKVIIKSIKLVTE